MEWVDEKKKKLKNFTREEFYDSKKKFTRWNLTESAIRESLINDELKPYAIKFEDIAKLKDGKVIENGEEILWCAYYAFQNKEEYDSWKKYALDVLTIKFGKKTAEREAPWFILIYALRTEWEWEM